MKTILFTNVGADMYGADYVLLCLVRSLNRDKYRSIVLVPYDGPLVRELEGAGAEVHIREFPVLRRAVFTPLGLFGFCFRMVTAIFFLLRMARREHVSLFHTNTASLWPPGIAARILRKTHYWQVMELVESPRLVAWAMGKMTGVFSTKVFCISDAVRSHFLKFNPGRETKFETLYHGVDVSEYDPARCNREAMREKLGIPQQARVVLYAGRFSAWKGQDVFAAAIDILTSGEKNGQLNLHFIMLGSCFPGQEEHERVLDEILAGSAARARIHKAGFQKNLPEWMAASDIFVLPSKRPEPNATVLIGAMAMGLACVGTNIGGTVETILDGETGLLIPPDDPQALARALATLISDPGLVSQMGQAGKARAEKVFSMANYCKRVQEAYE